MNKLTFLLVFVFFTTLSFGQQKETILFESDSYRLTPFQTEKINVLLNQVGGENCFISISGHTDSDADDAYNLTLSANRVESVTTYVNQHFPSIKIQQATHFGEQKPIINNHTEQNKALNRRVEIIVTCNEIKQKETTGNVWPLLNQVQPLPTDLHFDGAKGGVFNLKNGAHISIAPNTFPSGQVNLKVSECLTIGDAFAYGLTTQSNQTGDGLQSKGMYRLQAFQNGRMLPNVKANDITIYVRVDTNDYQTFDAVQEGKYTEWNTRTSSDDKFIRPYLSLCELTTCDLSLNKKQGRSYVNCNFFWCKIKSFFSRRYKREKESYTIYTISSNPNFKSLYNVYKTDLDKAFGDEAGFAAFVANNTYKTILDKMNELFPRFTSDLYYAMQMPSYSWVNCDRFTNYSNLTTVSIPEVLDDGKDIRLYFNDINCVMRPNGQTDKKTKFNRVPIGQIVTLVILKKVNDVLLMSSERFKTGDQPNINFKEVNSSDLESVFNNH